ncbi:MAG: hypothetical protein SFU27_11695 [Thermonemataceae bacterium]|nr:hypothetical protein [Thermonemataceae bacterium]
MHLLMPFHRWLPYYDPATDENSPFFGKEYNYDLYSDTIYGYYIDPAWDYMGSETLYIKLLFVDYEENFAIIELIGEWNDAIENDIMIFKTNVINPLIDSGINQFMLLGENVFNFHGSDDCYYEEWFEDVEDGWITALQFRDFVYTEWQKYGLDSYINFGGTLEILNWRTLSPHQFYEQVKKIISYRLN